ncbi:linker for activation of T cells, isoform CRA_b [Rattus norvegicus]|uniref:Linker for activation of T cells, isoform CRA_b n=1 Tax=Rattus norvegicus TaxID=10116 RepID=A6I941_RAT|nr:linker for activation of T cells, isoform CRA_b [Rattus norvegicus]
MEADALSPVELGLLLLPFVVMLLAALCVRCRELPASYDSASTESLYPRSILIKPPREFRDPGLPRGFLRLCLCPVHL